MRTQPSPGLLRLLFLLPCTALLCACPPESPPDPDPEPIAGSEEEVLVPAEELELEGTLLLPDRAEGELVAGVVLAHGSGPHGRDSVLPVNFPQAPGLSVATFSDLALALQEAGYAVLRYDKRTCGPFNGLCDNDYPTPGDLPGDLLVSHFQADAEAALDWLAARPEVDPSRLVLAGHSQGGSFPILLAEARPELLAAGVMLAGPYQPIDALLQFQYELNINLLLDAGYSQAQAEAQMTDILALIEALADLREPPYEGSLLSPGEVAFWDEWLQMTDEAPTIAAGLDLPLLAISGDYDWNVPPEDTESWALLFEGVESDPGHEAIVLSCVTHALNCIRDTDWLEVTPDEVDDFVSPDLIAAVLDFLDSSLD